MVTVVAAFFFGYYACYNIASFHGVNNTVHVHDGFVYSMFSLVIENDWWIDVWSSGILC